MRDIVMRFMRTVTEHTPGLQARDYERLLIERAQAGDRQAFEELIFKYDRDILRLTVRLLGNPDEASALIGRSILCHKKSGWSSN